MLQGYRRDGPRRPFGHPAGAPTDNRPDDLAGQGGQAQLARSELPVDRIEDVMMGNVCEAGEDSHDLTRFPNRGFGKADGDFRMPQTAADLAKDDGITRTDCDASACRGRQGSALARKAGFRAVEITPIRILHRKGEPLVETGEHQRPETSLEQMAALKPLFAGGVVTAANASGARMKRTAMRNPEQGGRRPAGLSNCIGLGQGVAMVIKRVN